MAQLHLTSRCFGDDVAVNKSLIGFAEGEGELVGAHELLVLFLSFRLHLDCVLLLERLLLARSHATFPQRPKI